MQVSLSPAAPSLPLSGSPITGSATDAQKSARRDDPTLASERILRPEAKRSEPDPALQALPTDANVSISGAAATRSSDYAAPVIAEIWKDGLKVAQVDSQGGVTSFIGLMPGGTGGGGGPLSATLRAAQIAQSIGGEIRVAGQVIDGATLAMRARLRQLYGA